MSFNEMAAYLLADGCPADIINQSSYDDIENMYHAVKRENRRESRRGFECSMFEQFQAGV